MSSCPEDSEILFAESWIHHPLGFGLEMPVQPGGWAGLCHKQQSLMGLLFFLLKIFCRNGCGQSSPWPRAFAQAAQKCTG